MAWRRGVKRGWVAEAIAGTLAVTAGCTGWANCGGTQEVDDTFVLKGETLDWLVESDDMRSTWSDVPCEAVCESLSGAFEFTAEACTLSLPVTDTTGKVTAEGSVVCKGKGVVMCEGRRPLATAGFGQADPASVGAVLAHMATLERDSVTAFAELAVQLRTWGAPATLAARCDAAAEDERRHHRDVAALAEGWGGLSPAGPSPAATSSASLYAVALHNAVEGCVHETWAAYLAAERARRAATPELRAAFARIAEDEARHGQLAWDLHAWFLTQLPAHEAAQVQAAQAEALARLPTMALAQSALPEALGPVPTAVARRAATDFATRLTAAG